MVTSLDGKITGNFLEKSEYGEFIEDYYRIHREYTADGFLCGRITMEDSFASSLVKPISNNEYDGLREDYIAQKAKFYAVSIDPRGKLWWANCAISDLDEGYNNSHIIEVITEEVSVAFLSHLKEKGVSYIFGGKTELNLSVAVQKLKTLFGIEKLLLEGGGIVNGAFLQAGLIDEISLVVIPAAEPSPEAIPLFQTGKYQTDSDATVSFDLKEIKPLENGGFWLNYKK
jgi:hypothetical protein